MKQIIFCCISALIITAIIILIGYATMEALKGNDRYDELMSEYIDIVIVETTKYHTVFYDKNTMNMYIAFRSYASNSDINGITPIYDTDGNIMKYAE